jgi:hypothetical protein
MVDAGTGKLEQDIRAALSLMEQALAVLDRCDDGLDAGAHLDLAICRLRDVLEIDAAEAPDRDATHDAPVDHDALPWSKAS